MAITGMPQKANRSQSSLKLGFESERVITYNHTKPSLYVNRASPYSTVQYTTLYVQYAYSTRLQVGTECLVRAFTAVFTLSLNFFFLLSLLELDVPISRFGPVLIRSIHQRPSRVRVSCSSPIVQLSSIFNHRTQKSILINQLRIPSS